jgi:hypothetical protein
MFALLEILFVRYRKPLYHLFLLFRHGFLSKAKDFCGEASDFIKDTGSNDQRVRTFGVVIGCTHDNKYAPRLGLFCLNLINNFMPDNIGNFMLEHHSREFFVTVDKALAVLKVAFEMEGTESPAQRTFFSIETIELEDSKAQELVLAVQSMAEDGHHGDSDESWIGVDVDKLMAKCIDIWVAQNEKDKVPTPWPPLSFPREPPTLIHCFCCRFPGRSHAVLPKNEKGLPRPFSLLGVQKNHYEVLPWIPTF